MQLLETIKDIVTKNWFLWVVIGVLIRVLLMPLTAHPDLYSIYFKSSALAFDGIVYPAKFAVLWLYFHATVIKFYSFFWPEIGLALPIDATSLEPNIQLFLAGPNVFRLIFLFKLPFLGLELLTIGLFTTLFKSASDKLIAIKAWMLNPFLIYALYLHGRNEILTIFFIVVFWKMVTRQKLLLASLALGVSIAIRFFTILALPIYLLLIPRNIKSWLVHSVIALGPILMSVLFMKTFATKTITSLQSAPLSVNFLFPVNIGVGHGEVIYLLLAGLMLIFFYGWYYQQVNYQNIWHWISIIFLFSLGLMFFHPQYFAWLTPFITWMIVTYHQKRSQLLLLLGLQFVGWLLALLFWGNAVTFGLFAPISPYFFNALGSPLRYLSWLQNIVDPISLGRTIIFAVHTFLIGILWTSIRKSKQNK
jgi:hypothetical protein